MARDPQFIDAKDDVIENLEAMQLSLVRCVEEKLVDLEDAYYDEVVDLIDRAQRSGTWEELMAVVTRGKTLETDVAAWLSMHGRTSMSLPWPKRN